jgi:hypothetical protein
LTQWFIEFRQQIQSALADPAKYLAAILAASLARDETP